MSENINDVIEPAVMAKVKDELRGHMDTLVNESKGKFEAVVNEIRENAKKEVLASVEAERAKIEKEAASLLEVRQEPVSKREFIEAECRKVSDELVKTRAVTLSSTSVGIVDDIITKLTNETGGLIDLIDFGTSPVQLGTVPVFTPLAEATYVGEGATGITPDASAGLAAQSLNLQPYASVLAVSNGVDIFSALGPKLPDAYANCFRRTIVKQILQGTGTSSFTGLNTNAAINQLPAATGSVAGGLKWADLIKAIKQFKGMYAFDDVSKLAIVIHPTVIQDCITNSTNSALDIATYQSYLNNSTIQGVKIVESPYAPSTKTTALAAAVIGYFPHYVARVSSVFKLNAIPVTRTDNVEYNGISYMDGKPVVNTSFLRLNFLT